MKKQFVLGISALTLLVSATINAETIKIGVGSPDSEYVKIIVPAINQALQEHGYTAVAEISTGIQQDIDNVMAGEISAALSQIDVAALNMTTAKDPNENLLLLWGRIALRALFCVAHKGGSVMTYNDLTAKREPPLNVSIGDEKSEIVQTFQYLMKLEPELKNLKFHYKPRTRVEFSRLLSGRRDLVCFVAIPNPEHELIKRVMEHDELFFIGIEHPSFSDVKIGKNRIYDIMEVPVTKGVFGFNAEKVKTVVTWIGMVVNEKKVDEKTLDILSAAVMKPDLLTSNTLGAKAGRFFDKIMTQIGEAID